MVKPITTLDVESFFSYMLFCIHVAQRDEGVLIKNMTEEDVVRCREEAKYIMEMYFAEEEY